MGIQLEKNARFLGVPMVKARNALKAWAQGASRNASDIAARADVKLSVPEGMMLLQEFVERGMTETALRDERFPGYGFHEQLSEAGKAFVSASGRKRTDRDKAQSILDGLLSRCAELANDPDAPYHVDRVWLYGSMLGNAPDVGDLDIVVSKRWSPKYEAIKDAEERAETARRYAAGRVPASTMNSFFGSLFAAHTLFDRLVFGDRKHPLFSVGSEDELKRLACRCRLLFDSDRGGRVLDPAIVKHPGAGVRDPAIGEQRQMPDLVSSTVPLRPLSVDWLPLLEIYYNKNADLGTFAPDDSLYRLNIPAQGQCHFVSSAADLSRDFRPSVLFQRAGAEDLDGVHRSLLVLSSHRAPPALVVKIARTIDDAIEPTYGIDMTWHVKRGAEQGHFVNAVEGIMALAGADILRLSRRLSERGVEDPIKVRFNIAGDCPDDTVYWTLYHALSSGRWLAAMPDEEIERLRLSFSTPDGPVEIDKEEPAADVPMP